MMRQRIICWFSCGIASAIATKMILDENHEDKEVLIVYTDTGAEHEDNKRFLRECEQWYKKKITTLKSDKYDDIWEVFEKTKFLVSAFGARCTMEMKKAVRTKFQREDDIHIFGFDSTEEHRFTRMGKESPELLMRAPLIEKHISKTQCFEIFNYTGIKRPVMYRLGFNNNNCIGCVKGGIGYWNHIRKHFPDVFDRMAKVERDIKHTICRVGEDSIYLDELPADKGRHKAMFEEDLFSHSMSCGFICDGGK
jgi:hypothetical protein